MTEFSNAYTRLVQPTFELTALDDYPSLMFASPPADFEPQRLRVENRRLMNALAVPRPDALKRTAPAAWLKNARDSSQKTTDLDALDNAPDFAGPVAFPQARTQIVDPGRRTYYANVCKQAAAEEAQKREQETREQEYQLMEQQITDIQSHLRGFAARRTLNERATAAKIVQRCARAHALRKKFLGVYRALLDKSREQREKSYGSDVRD